MHFEKLGQLITEAVSHEEESHLLARHLQKVTAGLHSTVMISNKNNSTDALIRFIIKYIEHAPKFLSVMAKVSAEANMRGLTLPLIKVSEEFFLNPPEILGNEKNLERLMESSYLTHRMIEEVNDRFLASRGKVLIPVDMITANLIIHNLIGEPFSNQLDAFCFELAKEIVPFPSTNTEPSSPTFITTEQQITWTKAWMHWSELLDESHVKLSI
ncbi:MAG: hypothetical protein KUG83_04070 [Gammaproteobacteria bacterium]|nr:hypothetical protein [Gammaproteobacteria bacterium]